MSEHDKFLNRVVSTLKEPVQIDAALDRRVMAEIETMPRLELLPAPRSAWQWLTERRTVSISPIGGFALAAALAMIVVFGARTVNQVEPPVTLADVSLPAGTNAVQFVLVAPEAGSVSLVGDFNDWNVAATQLVREEGGGVWAVTVPLTPGRYRYSFLVDGETWLRDPQAARTVEDEFGRPNSVLTIGGA